MIGVWPLIMGVTMWLQMKLNPAPTDPVQAKMFTGAADVHLHAWRRSRPGLVIYWAWNNTLSIAPAIGDHDANGVDIRCSNLGFKANEERQERDQELAFTFRTPAGACPGHLRLQCRLRAWMRGSSPA